MVLDAQVLDAVELTGTRADTTIDTLLADWPAAEHRIRDALASGRDASRLPLSGVTLLPPVPMRAAIYCAGANYYGHAKEMADYAGRPAPADPRTSGGQPWHFLKAPGTTVGDGATVTIPAAAPTTLDWEVELAAVIGAEARNVSAADALDYVAGYTVANDLSARALLWREGLATASPFRADWMSHKNFDGSCPIGPWLVPAADISDPQHLGLGLRVNGADMQGDNTSDMIFTVAEQIAHLSSLITLHPGDVVLSGTPGGVGSVRGQFLAAGDVVEAWVEGIGTLTTRIS